MNEQNQRDSIMSMARGAFEEPESGEEDEPDIGSVTLHLPAFRAMAVCNQHLDHGPLCHL